MSIPNHFLVSGSTAYLLTQNWLIAIICALVGSYMDWEKKLRGLKNDEYDRIYTWYHNWKNPVLIALTILALAVYGAWGSWYWLLIIGMWWLHILVDYPIHKPEGGINKYYMPVEYIFYAINLVLLAIIITKVL